MSRRAARPPGALPTLAGVVVLLSLTLVGCSAEPDTPPAPEPTSTVVAPTPATTPVPPPTPGTVESSVPSRKLTKRKPVDLDASGEAADGVRVQVRKVEAIEAEAVGPGEVAGPGLALTIEIDNSTSQDVNLGASTVTMTGSDKEPAAGMAAPPASPFPGVVTASAKVSGVYVFTLPENKRKTVTVEVTVHPNDPVVVFRGSAPS